MERSFFTIPLSVLFLSSVAFATHRHPTAESSQALILDDDAIRQLSEVFDVTNLKLSRIPRSGSRWNLGKFNNESNFDEVGGGWSAGTVPAYMINLYNTIADKNGVMRVPNPFNANLIQSFPNKYAGDDRRLLFNLDSLKGTEMVLHAELHLQLRKVSRTCRDSPSANGKDGDDGKVILRVYQLATDPSNLTVRPASHHLLSTTAINRAALDENFETKQIIPLKSAVLHWIQSPKANHGLYVEISALDDPNDCFVTLELDNEPGGQPSLIVYMDDGRPDRHPKYRIKSLSKQAHYLKQRTSRLGHPELFKSFSTTPQQKLLLADPSEYTYRVRRSVKTAKVAFSRSIKSKSKKYQRTERTFPYKAKTKGPCRRQDLYVSFQDIGWSKWIISPKGFQAYHCRGDCRFPLGQESRPSNHAIVTSIINHMKFPKKVAPPCCVPDQLYSLSLLYFDHQQSVVLKQYDDMVAQSCACR